MEFDEAIFPFSFKTQCCNKLQNSYLISFFLSLSGVSLKQLGDFRYNDLKLSQINGIQKHLKDRKIAK